MTELAAHGATLRKNDEADSRSIDRAERFEFVDSSESHGVKIKNLVALVAIVFGLLAKTAMFVLYNTNSEKKAVTAD